MKRNFKFVFSAIVLISTFLPFFSFSQYVSGITAGFGIDGDVLSGQSQNINPTTTTGSFDWFKAIGSSSTGFGVIDTVGTASYKSQLLSSQNISFNAGMAYPRFSAQNGYLLLDARYGRDRIGNNQSNVDLTSFTGGSKTGDNPTTWTTAPNGTTSLSDKADIVDSYIHLRRNGTIINNTNPSALILAMGVSTLGNSGNRYVDFEFYHSRIAYNTTTGLFSNSGPAITGGHTAWTFNSNGSVNAVGDMTVSFSYNTGGISEVSVYVWVGYATYLTTSPSKFNFVSNSFYGSTYGYAKITSLNGTQFDAWASSSTANTPGPVWGTSSKSAGSGATSFSTQYAAYDFGEVAIDLTSLGIDPALSTTGFDACMPPFTRVITKTRSSSTITSALQDFAGPYEFLDAPEVSPSIAAPTVLKCNATSSTLAPSTPVSGASYQWSTASGNIVSTSGSNAVVDRAGKYYLTSAVVMGCATKTDSTTVLEDKNQPVASATVLGSIIASNPSSTAQLIGGDVLLSNYPTPFGGSTGLNWNWSGPNSFGGNTKDAFISKPGIYTLILTEQRNGCSDTAFVPVATLAGPLAVKYLSLNAAPVEKSAVAVTWVTSEEINHNHFEVERSFDLNTFKTIAIVLDGFSAGTQKSYAYTDKSIDLQNKTVVYYRLKQVDNDGRFTYSRILSVKLKIDTDVAMEVSPNPFAESLHVRYTASKVGIAQLNIIAANGKIILTQTENLNIGTNSISINGLSKLNAGLYLARISINGVITATEKIIKR